MVSDQETKHYRKFLTRIAEHIKDENLASYLLGVEEISNALDLDEESSKTLLTGSTDYLGRILPGYTIIGGQTLSGEGRIIIEKRLSKANSTESSLERIN